MLHNGGFCNGCITKRRLHNSRNVPYNDLVSQLLFDKKKMKVINNVIFWDVLNNIGFS